MACVLFIVVVVFIERVHVNMKKETSFAMVIAIIQFFHLKPDTGSRKRLVSRLVSRRGRWMVYGGWTVITESCAYVRCCKKETERLSHILSFQAGLDRTVGPDYRFIQGQDALDRDAIYNRAFCLFPLSPLHPINRAQEHHLLEVPSEG